MSALATTTSPSAFSVFRNRSFTLLWIAQLISSLGTALTALAASILVYRITGSALSVGLMLMATAAPTLFVGLIAGVFVDRWDRKRMMVICEVARAALVALIPVLLPYGIAWLYIMVMLSSTVAQFFDPAHASMLPEVASSEELAAANSMMTISSISADVLGFAAAGFIAAQLSIEWAFYLDALSFLVSAVCIARLSILPHTPADDTNVAAVLSNLRAGIRFVYNTPVLQSLFLIFMGVFCLFGFANALNLPFAIRVLGLSEVEYGLIEGIALIGFIVGSLVMANRADRLHDGQWLALSLLGMGMVSIFYAASVSLGMALAFNLLIYFTNAPSYIVRALIIQRHTPRQMLGRVNSAFYVVRDVVFLVGMAAAGLADLFDVRLLLVVAAILLICLGLVALRMPGMRQSGAEWQHALSMLRRAASVPGLGLGRAALPADVDRLVGRLPVLAELSAKERRQLSKAARVYQVPAGTAIVRHGDTSDAAFFLLDGRTVAGREEAGAYRSLEVLHAGDFFGEIAAMTGVPRTADVITEQPTTLLQLPAATLRQMMNHPHVHRLLLSQMTARMLRMNMIELPRVASVDHTTMRELRTPERISRTMTVETYGYE